MIIADPKAACAAALEVLHSQIEHAARAAHDGIRVQARDSREFINRSCGQRLRYLKERNSGK